LLKGYLHLSENKIALIIGVNGQDGSYLAEFLSGQGWAVIGVGRQSACRLEIQPFLTKYYAIDIVNVVNLQQCLEEVKPDLIFHTAAIHGPAGFNYEQFWLAAHQVNVISLHATLEYIRARKISARLIYFSSSKVFGILDGQVIDEFSERYSDCIYSITKNSSESLIAYYRKMHNINASVIWLFNHESVRRSPDYFVMKIVMTLKNSLSDSNFKSYIESLDFWCDWGSAREYMQVLAQSINLMRNEDYILSTGKTVWARDVVSEFFQKRGLSFERHIVVLENSKKQPEKIWTASNALFKSVAGITPSIYGVQVFEEVFSGL